MVRTADINNYYLRVANSDALVRKSDKDFWQLEKTADGAFQIRRLVDSGGPVVASARQPIAIPHYVVVTVGSKVVSKHGPYFVQSKAKRIAHNINKNVPGRKATVITSNDSVSSTCRRMAGLRPIDQSNIVIAHDSSGWVWETSGSYFTVRRAQTSGVNLIIATGLDSADINVIDGFYSRSAASSENMTTDGTTLWSTGKGSQEMATWMGGTAYITADLTGPWIDKVVKYMRASFPPNVLEDSP